MHIPLRGPNFEIRNLSDVSAHWVDNISIGSSHSWLSPGDIDFIFIMCSLALMTPFPFCFWPFKKCYLEIRTLNSVLTTETLWAMWKPTKKQASAGKCTSEHWWARILESVFELSTNIGVTIRIETVMRKELSGCIWIYIFTCHPKRTPLVFNGINLAFNIIVRHFSGHCYKYLKHICIQVWIH